MNYRSICVKCVRFDPDVVEGMEDVGPRCAAFPDGIPDEILRLGFDHRNEYPGDNGVRFEPDGPVDVAWIEKTVAETSP